MYRFLALFLVNILATTWVYAELTPQWVKKGVAELEKMRSNNTYSFHIFHEEEQNQTLSELNRLKPLLEYVDKTYGVSQQDILVDSILADDVLPTTYTLKFLKDDTMQTVFAVMVDSYYRMNDYADNTYDYNFWQLYAISNPGMTPEFDNFNLKKDYGVKPVLMSIIPGMGQIYKGEAAKGYTLLGVEAAMAASIIFATTKINKWNDMANKYPEFYDSYQSKADSFRQWRTFCFVAGGALYAYNILDAAFAKGARYVTVKRNAAPDMRMTFSPMVANEYLGIGININF